MSNMEKQIKLLNCVLRQIYQLQKEERKLKKKQREENDQVVEMLEKHNKNKEYFYFEVYLLEKIPKRNGAVIYNNKLFPNVSPQEIYLGCLKGENTYLKYRDVILYQNANVNLSKMVTPNLNKNIWYLETDLIRNRLIKVLCKMNLINMKNMLKNCPVPEICFFPSIYKINDPESFVKVINDNIKYKKVLDFIPYVREYSFINNFITREGVYYLYDKIKLVPNKCLN